MLTNVILYFSHVRDSILLLSVLNSLHPLSSKDNLLSSLSDLLGPSMIVSPVVLSICDLTTVLSPASTQHKGDLHSLPYKASYEAMPILAWKLLLYANSTRCR